MREQPFQSATVSQGVIRSGESVTGGPIHFIGKDTWVKLAGGDLPGSITVNGGRYSTTSWPASLCTSF